MHNLWRQHAMILTQSTPAHNYHLLLPHLASRMITEHTIRNMKIVVLILKFSHFLQNESYRNQRAYRS